MKQFEYIIKDELGIHARPAGLLAKKAKAFECAVSIEKGEKKVDASKLIAVMGMGIKQGDKVVVYAQGADEDTAIEELKNFFQLNL